MSPEEIAQHIEAALPGATVRVASEDGVHFAALGLRPLQRHQLVYRALGGAMGGAIHALSLDTPTPEEWARRTG